MTPPRPVFETLPKAVQAALRFSSRLEEINLHRWATTYGCTPDDVRGAWLHELSKETNANCVGEGK